MIKLLIVDDSALMRRQLAAVFKNEPDIDIRLARNGREAVEENKNFLPDVVTLDINMPEMDGLTALSIMMQERPVPVVMVSSLTEKGALATFEALNLGAIDYIVKPGGTISLSIDTVRDQIVSKVRNAVKAKIKKGKTSEANLVSVQTPPKSHQVVQGAKPSVETKEGVVLIGVSTGGPRTLEMILPHLPAEFPWPILVAQHMPASFTLSFAQRLNDLCPLNVVEASRPLLLEAGTVYVGKGGADMQIVRRSGKLHVIAKPESQEFLWHPSVEILGRSALENLAPSQIIGVMLTGMGYDGADAFAEVRKKGGKTIAESEESAVVFGMPSELIKRGGATVTLSVENIAQQLRSWLWT